MFYHFPEWLLCWSIGFQNGRTLLEVNGWCWDANISFSRVSKFRLFFASLSSFLLLISVAAEAFLENASLIDLLASFSLTFVATAGYSFSLNVIRFFGNFYEKTFVRRTLWCYRSRTKLKAQNFPTNISCRNKILPEQIGEINQLSHIFSPQNTMCSSFHYSNSLEAFYESKVKVLFTTVGFANESLKIFNCSKRY